MSVYNEMKEMLQNVEVDKSSRNKIKFLVGEFQRNSKNIDKSVNDEEAIKILKKIKKNNNETINLSLRCDNYEIEYIIELNEFIDKFIPKEYSENEIKDFIKTLDFSKYKNKMQSIGVIMKHFNGNVDGKLVKKIILQEID